jgi:hypothetical protein
MNMAGGKMMFQEHKKVNFLSIMFISTVQYLNYCSGHFLSNVSKCREHDNIDNIFEPPPPLPPIIDVIFATGVRHRVKETEKCNKGRRFVAYVLQAKNKGDRPLSNILSSQSNDRYRGPLS